GGVAAGAVQRVAGRGVFAPAGVRPSTLSLPLGSAAAAGESGSRGLPLGPVAAPGESGSRAEGLPLVRRTAAETPAVVGRRVARSEATEEGGVAAGAVQRVAGRGVFAPAGVRPSTLSLPLGIGTPQAARMFTTDGDMNQPASSPLVRRIATDQATPGTARWVSSAERQLADGAAPSTIQHTAYTPAARRQIAFVQHTLLQSGSAVDRSAPSISMPVVQRTRSMATDAPDRESVTTSHRSVRSPSVVAGGRQPLVLRAARAADRMLRSIELAATTQGVNSTSESDHLPLLAPTDGRTPIADHAHGVGSPVVRRRALDAPARREALRRLPLAEAVARRLQQPEPTSDETRAVAYVAAQRRTSAAADTSLPVARSTAPAIDALFTPPAQPATVRRSNVPIRDAGGKLPLLSRTIAGRSDGSPLMDDGVSARGLDSPTTAPGGELARAIESVWATPTTGPAAVVQRTLSDTPASSVGDTGMSDTSSTTTPDIEELARQVYARLRRRFLIDAERIGR
ncbi:MAG TPA: hypothetical protein PKA05_14775, partial [Roseiflexaceae bacterium]|nr:hypothetical protein [Roseiflexaceae bacterium]